MPSITFAEQSEDENKTLCFLQNRPINTLNVVFIVQFHDAPTQVLGRASDVGAFSSPDPFVPSRSSRLHKYQAGDVAAYLMSATGIVEKTEFKRTHQARGEVMVNKEMKQFARPRPVRRP